MEWAVALQSSLARGVTSDLIPPYPFPYAILYVRFLSKRPQSILASPIIIPLSSWLWFGLCHQYGSRMDSLIPSMMPRLTYVDAHNRDCIPDPTCSIDFQFQRALVCDMELMFLEFFFILTSTSSARQGGAVL
jgi:hypothetical protein